MTAQVIRWVERKEPKERRRRSQPIPADNETIIACEDIEVDFQWSGREIREFIHMWEQGLSLYDIAHGAFPDRNPDDVVWLWMHCDYHGWIKDRPGGIYGRRRKPEKGGDRMIEIWANWLDDPAEFLRQWELFWIDGEEVSK